MSKNEICAIVSNLCLETSEWIKAQPAVKEESITDYFLYQLSRRSRSVKYRLFNRHEEAREYGADWDWYFLFDDGLAAFRVQAKRLLSSKDNYPGLARSNRHGQQIVMLLESSAKDSVFPIYAFYSCVESKSRCSRIFVQSGGIYFSSAKKIDLHFLKIREKISELDVINESYPLQCLFCCESMTVNSAKSLIARIKTIFPSDTIGLDNRGYFDKMPSFIKSVVDNNFIFPAYWDSEYLGRMESTNGIVIVDRRSA